ncbi:MAG: hypothetical protein V1729_04810 [Candidatus Woesearchaeota archaeon]
MAEVNNVSSALDMGDKLKKAYKLSKALRADQKLYKKAKKRMLKVTEKKVNKITLRYRDKPEKARAKLVDLLNELMSNCVVFIEEIQRIFKETDSIVIELEREEYDDLDKISKIVERWSDHKYVTVFTEGAIADLEKEYHEFEQYVAKFIKKDVKDDKLMAHGEKPKEGFFTRIASEASLASKIFHLSKKSRRRKYKVALVEAEVDHQLSSDHIEANFPQLFAKLLKEEGVLEVIMHRIREDIKQFIRDIVEDSHDVLFKVVPIVRVFVGYPEMDQYRSRLEEMADIEKTVGKKSVEYAYMDFKAEKALYSQLMKQDNILKYMIHHLYDMRQQDIIRVQKSLRQAA